MNINYLFIQIFSQVAVFVVSILRCEVRTVGEGHTTAVGRRGGIVIDRLQPVALVGQGQIIKQAMGVGTGLTVAEQARNVAVTVVARHLLVETAGVGLQLGALAVDGIFQAVQTVVGEAVATGNSRDGCSGRPFQAADIAVIASRARTVGIMQLL